VTNNHAPLDFPRNCRRGRALRRRHLQPAGARAPDGGRGLERHRRPAQAPRRPGAAAQALPQGDVAKRAQAEGALSASLGRLFALAENYPDLKASSNFLELQRNLSDLENELQMARRYYNGATRNQNVLVQSFPSNLIAGVGGFSQRAFFQLDDASERAAPQVTLAQP
jgi:hypothetical protein